MRNLKNWPHRETLTLRLALYGTKTSDGKGMRVYEENIDLEGETVDKVIEARETPWCRTYRREQSCAVK